MSVNSRKIIYRGFVVLLATSFAALFNAGFSYAQQGDSEDIAPYLDLVDDISELPEVVPGQIMESLEDGFHESTSLGQIFDEQELMSIGIEMGLLPEELEDLAQMEMGQVYTDWMGEVGSDWLITNVYTEDQLLDIAEALSWPISPSGTWEIPEITTAELLNGMAMRVDLIDPEVLLEGLFGDISPQTSLHSILSIEEMEALAEFGIDIPYYPYSPWVEQDFLTFGDIEDYVLTNLLEQGGAGFPLGDFLATLDSFDSLSSMLGQDLLGNLAGALTSMLGSLGGGCCSCICDCVGDQHEDRRDEVEEEHEAFREEHSPTEFEEHRRLLIEDMFVGYLLPAMMMMTEQVTVVAMQQVQMLGAFFDAKHQLETQQLIQSLQAQAHKDYRPSVGLCKIGTASASLNASAARSDWTKIVLSQRSVQRQLGTYGTAAQGVAEDTESRLQYFRTTHCDPRDLNYGLIQFCEPETSADRWNKDIDYSRTVSQQPTLNINFLSTATGFGAGLTPDEEAVFELHSYLYGHQVFSRIPAMYLEDPPVETDVNRLQDLYLDIRSIVAKRSVAENSFVHNVAIRAHGTPMAQRFTRKLAKELTRSHMTEYELMGDDPSYFAQMKALTEFLVYNPDFYVNLYDSPANVLRKRVALQAIGIMQKWDTLESMWRTEVAAAVSASVNLDEAQEDVQNEINEIRGQDMTADEFIGGG